MIASKKFWEQPFKPPKAKELHKEKTKQTKLCNLSKSQIYLNTKIYLSSFPFTVILSTHNDFFNP